MATASTTLPAEASSVPTARRWVERVLADWGCPQVGWTAASVISELATNCHLHAGTPFTVALSRTGDSSFLLEITDDSPVLPRQRSYGLESTTGRGLAMVDRLSDDWGVQRFDDRPGKTVWVRLSDRAEASDDSDLDVDLDTLLAAFDDPDGADVVGHSRPARGAAPASGRIAA